MRDAQGLGGATKAFSNWRHNSIVLNFANGNSLSSVWGMGSYSDNHMAEVGAWEQFSESDTVEVMFDCGDRLHKRLHRKFNGDGSVIRRLSMTDWLHLVNALANEQKGGE